MTTLSVCLPDTELEGLAKAANMLGVTKEYVISLAVQDFVSDIEITPECTQRILRILHNVDAGVERIHPAEDVYRKAEL